MWQAPMAGSSLMIQACSMIGSQARQAQCVAGVRLVWLYVFLAELVISVFRFLEAHTALLAAAQ
jgi:hypothetical protein